MRKIIFFSSLVVCVGAVAQKKNYNAKGCIDIVGSKTTLTVTTTPKNVGAAAAAAGAIAAAIIPAVVDVAVPIIKEKVKKNALSFTGEYKASLSGQEFYKDANNVNLPTLTLKREIIDKKKQSHNAVNITIGSELSRDNSAIRFFVNSNFLYNYSIARTKKEYDYIDIQFEIRMKSLAIVKGEYKLSDLRTTLINVPLVEVGNTTALNDTYSSGWIPLPSRSEEKITHSVTTDDTKTVKTTKGQAVETVTEKTTLMKEKVEEYKPIAIGTGLYEIEIVVTETNPYKIKAENKKEMIDATSDAGVTLLKTIIEQSFKKDEEKKAEE